MIKYTLDPFELTKSIFLCFGFLFFSLEPALETLLLTYLGRVTRMWPCLVEKGDPRSPGLGTRKLLLVTLMYL